jgi:alpha-1,6-mannosyltransferase
VGYNTIGILGKVFPLVALVGICTIALRKKLANDLDLVARMSWSLLIYFLLSMIVHPWYVGFFVVLAVFSTQRFGLVWSFLVFLSYSAYAAVPYQECFWLVAIEYFGMIGAVVYFWQGGNRSKECEINKSAL